jgi:hypothetical protein
MGLNFIFKLMSCVGKTLCIDCLWIATYSGAWQVIEEEMREKVVVLTER